MAALSILAWKKTSYYQDQQSTRLIKDKRLPETTVVAKDNESLPFGTHTGVNIQLLVVCLIFFNASSQGLSVVSYNRNCARLRV